MRKLLLVGWWSWPRNRRVEIGGKIHGAKTSREKTGSGESVNKARNR